MAVIPRLAERIETLRTRAQVSGRPGVVTVAAPASDHDPLAIALSGGPEAMTFWALPSQGTTIGATGAAVSIEVDLEPKPGRFADVAEQIRLLRSRTTQMAVASADRAALLVGGFSFFDDMSWPGFPAARLVLPELALVKRRGTATWLAAAEVDADADAGGLASDLERRLSDAEAGEWAIAPAAPALEDIIGFDLRDDAYVKMVADAVEEISTSELDKVVVARQFILDHSPDLCAFLSALRLRFESCATFAFGTAQGVFCGATPELLASVDGISVETAAVAGTAPRGSDALGDDIIADRLRHDPKEIEEHEYVISEINRMLDQAGCVLGETAATQVMRLPGIQHLYTPITATAPVGTDVVDVVGAMHPTPAVGGQPGQQALDWIRGHEGLDRGWYAAPVGYCDLAGNGEFRVALRSCLVEAEQSRLFVGAGIVGASSPERELEETSLKLGALLPALLGS